MFNLLAFSFRRTSKCSGMRIEIDRVDGLRFENETFLKSSGLKFWLKSKLAQNSRSWSSFLNGLFFFLISLAEMTRIRLFRLVKMITSTLVLIVAPNNI